MPSQASQSWLVDSAAGMGPQGRMQRVGQQGQQAACAALQPAAAGAGAAGTAAALHGMCNAGRTAVSTHPSPLTLPVTPHAGLVLSRRAAAIWVVSRLLPNRLVTATAAPPQVVAKDAAHGRLPPAARHGCFVKYAAVAAARVCEHPAAREQGHRCRASSCRRRRQCCRRLPPPAWPPLGAPPRCALLLPAPVAGAADAGSAASGAQGRAAHRAHQRVLPQGRCALGFAAGRSSERGARVQGPGVRGHTAGCWAGAQTRPRSA